VYVESMCYLTEQSGAKTQWVQARRSGTKVSPTEKTAEKKKKKKKKTKKKTKKEKKEKKKNSQTGEEVARKDEKAGLDDKRKRPHQKRMQAIQSRAVGRFGAMYR